MRVLFSLGHPAHYHLFRNAATILLDRGHDVLFLSRNKDVLDDLVAGSGLACVNVEKLERSSWLPRKFSRYIRQLNLAAAYGPKVVVGSTVEAAHIGFRLGIPSLLLTEDDLDAVPQWSALVGPFASAIVAPKCCRLGRWNNKRIGYSGYHELAYLHPRYFVPNWSEVSGVLQEGKKHFLVRLSSLSAYHDKGVSGISDALASAIVQKLEPHGTVLLSSERSLPDDLARHLVSVSPEVIHHVLYFSDLYVGDSQTMAAEAAVLGTPSLRFNDFVGRLSYLEELEHTYNLTYGISTSTPELLFEKLGEILSLADSRKIWSDRKHKMLEATIDVTQMLAWLIEDAPRSVHKVREDPDFISETFGLRSTTMS